MTKLAIFLAVAIAASLIASRMIQARSQVATREKSVALQQQSEEITRLQAEQQHLAEQVQVATNSSAGPASGHTVELAKLRTQAASLRKQSKAVARQTKTPARPASTVSSATPENHPPEYWAQLRQAAGTKASDARDVAAAAYYYAMDHNDQVPASLDLVDSYLSKTGRTAPNTNRFELVFTGSLDQLKGLPNTSIALIRDTQTWQTPDGKQARVYGMVGGVGQIVTSDDNFQAWEFEHVIATKP